MSKYNEVMDRIELTEDMQNRILKNIDSYKKKKNSRRILRYVYALAACLILAVGIIVIINSSRIEKNPSDIVDTQGVYQFEEFQNVEDLSEAFGVDLHEVTGLPFDVKSRRYSALPDNFAQIEYYGRDDLENCCIRVGKDKNDISGDYNEYDTEKTVTCDDKTVTLKGIGDKIYLAFWVSNEHFCSVAFEKGVSEDDMMDVIRQIK